MAASTPQKSQLGIQGCPVLRENYSVQLQKTGIQGPSQAHAQKAAVERDILESIRILPIPAAAKDNACSNAEL